VVSTPLKNMSPSVGMIKFPIYGKIKAMFQTTNQIGIDFKGFLWDWTWDFAVDFSNDTGVTP